MPMPEYGRYIKKLYIHYVKPPKCSAKEDD